MKKLLIIALILQALTWAALAGAEVNSKKHVQERPAITHELVEKLTVECNNNFDIFQELPLKAFTTEELRLIKRYLRDNMKDKNLPQDSDSGMAGARHKLDIAIGEILGEITYSNAVNCFFISITDSYTNYNDCVCRLPSGKKFFFDVNMIYTIFGLKFPPAPRTPITLYYYYLKAEDEDDEDDETIKVMPWRTTKKRSK